MADQRPLFPDWAPVDPETSECVKRIEDPDIRRVLAAICIRMEGFGEVLDELAARVVALEERQGDFLKTVNQRLNSTEGSERED